MKLIFSICLCVLSLVSFAQTYTYAYIDPCTGGLKSLVIPTNGGVTFSYYGEIKTFSYDEVISGEFETWANSTFANNKNSSPCSEVVGLGTAVNITQSQALSVIGIMNSISSISDMMSSSSTDMLNGSTDMLGGAMGGIEKSDGSEGKSNNNQNNNTQTNKESNNQSTNQPNNQSTDQPNNQSTNGSNDDNSSTTTANDSNGSSSSNNNASNENNGQGAVSSTGSGTQESNTNSNPTPGKAEGNSDQGQVSTNEQGSGSGQSDDTKSTKEAEVNPSDETTSKGTEGEKGKTDITSGSSSTVKAALNKNGKPTIIASGDFIGFNFKNNSVTYGSKITGGYTSVKWDGTKTSGLLADYTSAIKGPNLTGFHAWLKTKAVTLVSATMTFGFEGYGSQYGTIAIGELRTFKKIKKLKVAYLATASFGKVYKTKFVGTALIVGGMYDIKLHKRLDLKLTNLFIYAPYVSYYNDIVMKSPYVVLPSAGFTVGITKRFKFNINVGGAWAIKQNTLNYTSTIGTRFIL